MYNIINKDRESEGSLFKRKSLLSFAKKRHILSYEAPMISLYFEAHFGNFQEFMSL